MLSKNELLQYQRQLGIKSWGKETQEKLKGSKVFIAGAGGLGSPLLFYLTAAGIGNLTIADFDKIDLTNLNRQILHNHKKIGTFKVDSAYQTLKELNPSVNIVRIYDKINKKNIASFVNDSDIIIDCLDNFKSRHILNMICIKKHIPMIHGGVSEFQGQITFLHPPETACLACFIPDKNTKGITYITGATAGVIGSLQAVEAIKYLTGIGNNLKNKILFWDGISMRFETVTIVRNPKCNVCK